MDAADVGVVETRGEGAPAGAGVTGRRLLWTFVLLAAAGLLAGCSPGLGTEGATSHRGPQPTAMTIEDGVEVWDLTAPPSAEAFGIGTSGRAITGVKVGAYSSSGGDGRPVRFLLPGEKTVDVRAHDVVFEFDDSPEGVIDSTTGEVLVPVGRSFALRVDGPAVEGADAGVARYREALDGLGLPADTVGELEYRIADGRTGEPGGHDARVVVDASLPREQGMQFSVGTLFRPGKDVPTFLLEYSANWDAVPIP